MVSCNRDRRPRARAVGRGARTSSAADERADCRTDRAASTGDELDARTRAPRACGARSRPNPSRRAEMPPASARARARRRMPAARAAACDAASSATDPGRTDRRRRSLRRQQLRDDVGRIARDDAHVASRRPARAAATVTDAGLVHLDADVVDAGLFSAFVTSASPSPKPMSSTRRASRPNNAREIERCPAVRRHRSAAGARQTRAAAPQSLGRAGARSFEPCAARAGAAPGVSTKLESVCRGSRRSSAHTGGRRKWSGRWESNPRL